MESLGETQVSTANFLHHNGNRRCLVLGPEDSGSKTIAYHLLRAIVRLALAQDTVIPILAFDQSGPLYFKRFGSALPVNLRPGWKWPAVATLRRPTTLEATDGHLVVAKLGHSAATRKPYLDLARVVVLTLSDRTPPKKLNTFLKATLPDGRSELPRGRQRILVCSQTQKDTPDMRDKILEWGEKLGAAPDLCFYIPYSPSMLRLISQRKDLWDVGGRAATAMDRATTAIISLLCSEYANWREWRTDYAARMSVRLGRQVQVDPCLDEPHKSVAAGAPSPARTERIVPLVAAFTWKGEYAGTQQLASAADDEDREPSDPADEEAENASKALVGNRTWSLEPMSPKLGKDTDDIVKQIVAHYQITYVEAVCRAICFAWESVMDNSSLLVNAASSIRDEPPAKQTRMNLSTRHMEFLDELTARMYSNPNRKRKFALQWAIRLFAEHARRFSWRVAGGNGEL